MNGSGHPPSGQADTRFAYLQAMGIQTWMLKTAETPLGQDAVHGDAHSIVKPPPDPVEQPPGEKPPVQPPPGDKPPVEPPPDDNPPVEQPPEEQPDKRPPGKKPPVEEPPTGRVMDQAAEVEIIPSRTAHQAQAQVGIPVRDVSAMGWPQLRATVAACTACVLHESRTQTVFGVGNEDAQWMIIGEAPGAEEDRQGEPFVGRAGKLLNNMLQAVGLKREQVYIANILKCRPPNNRDPRPEEVVQCEVYLRRQVELIQPKVILAVGRIAAHNLLQSHEALGRLRGSLHHYNEIPLVVTYHPAYLLRTPRDKAKAWDDLRFAARVVRGEGRP